jgi:hypothetical protein
VHALVRASPLPSPWIGRASRLAVTVCGPHRVTGYGHRIILICHESYASSLARWLCTDLGLHGGIDVIGGFRAWTARGLP